jgi:pimeloyl-ACP methyl ester carboxylesterase
MLNLKPLISHPNPAKTYAEAMQRAAVLQGRDGDNVNPLGRTLLLTHGFPGDRVVVWLHGYTPSSRAEGPPDRRHCPAHRRGAGPGGR